MGQFDNLNYRDIINAAFAAEGKSPYFIDTTTPITPFGGITGTSTADLVLPSSGTPVSYQADMINPVYGGQVATALTPSNGRVLSLAELAPAPAPSPLAITAAPTVSAPAPAPVSRESTDDPIKNFGWYMDQAGGDLRVASNMMSADNGTAPLHSAEQLAVPNGGWTPADQLMTKIWGSVEASPFADTYHAAQAQLPAPAAAPTVPEDAAPLTITSSPSANAAPPTQDSSRDLTPEQLAFLHQSAQAQMTPGSIYNGGVFTDPTGQTFTDQRQGGWQGGEAGYDSGPGVTTGYMRDVVPGHHRAGDMQDVYGADGTYKNTAAVIDDNLLDKLMPVLLGGFGAAAGAGLLSAGAAAGGAGSGGLAGDVLSKAALDGTTAFGANSVPGAFDLASMGGGAASASGATFNPAMDSQLANEWLASQGIDPMQGYVAAGNGGVTVNPVANSFANTSSTFNAAKDSQLANEAIQAQAPGFEQFGGNALDGYLTDAYGLPAVNPVPSQITPPGITGPTLPTTINPATVVKAVAAVVNGTGGGGGSGGAPGTGAAPAQPFDYGPARYGPTGWRDNRPLYVPGRDAIPEGWFGAGHTS